MAGLRAGRVRRGKRKPVSCAYADLAMARVRQVAEGCGVRRAADLNAEAVNELLGRLQSAGEIRKAQTRKHYERAPRDARRTGDMAYIGTGLETLTRRPRVGELTARQKAGNRRVSRRRIAAEHGIGKMKVWRVAAERYRNLVSRHTLIMKNVTGLHNLIPDHPAAYCAVTLMQINDLCVD